MIILDLNASLIIHGPLAFWAKLLAKLNMLNPTSEASDGRTRLTYLRARFPTAGIFRTMLPSGKPLHNHAKSPCFIGKSTISMVIFHCKLSQISRGFHVFFAGQDAHANAGEVAPQLAKVDLGGLSRSLEVVNQMWYSEQSVMFSYVTIICFSMFFQFVAGSTDHFLVLSGLLAKGDEISYWV